MIRRNDDTWRAETSAFSTCARRWSDVLSFGATQPSGATVVRVGGKHLLVGAGAYHALQHLSLVDPPLDKDATIRCLAAIVPPADAALLSEHLLSFLQQESLRERVGSDVARGMLRLPLWRPSPMLASRLQGRILHPILLWTWVAVVALAGASLTLRPMPHLHVLPASQWVLLWCLLTLTTAIHEAGHVLAAAHYGVRTRAVGVALFYLQPAGYADMSEAWLAARHARVVIALGGLVMQTGPLLLAYAVWRLTGTPLLGWYCVITFAYMAFNLLPFVRLDGYWCLSHLIDEPNLRQRALHQLRHAIAPRLHAPQWPGAQGHLAALFALLSLVFASGLYGTALMGIRALLPVHVPETALWLLLSLLPLARGIPLVVSRKGGRHAA